MGLSCANVQVRASLEELRAAAPKLKLEAVTLVRSPQSPWTAIYSPDFVPGDFDVVRKAAKSLSKELKTRAIAITVADSDEFWLDLFESGKSSAPLTNEGGSEPKLNPWAKTTGIPIHTLESICNRNQVFAEEYVRELVTALGIDPVLACSTFQTLGELAPEFERVVLEHARPAASTAEGPVIRNARLFMPLQPVQVEQNIGFAVSLESAGAEIASLEAHVEFDRTLLTIQNAGLSEVSAKFDRIWAKQTRVEQTDGGCIVRFPEFKIPSVATRKGKPIPFLLSLMGSAGTQPQSGEVHVSIRAPGCEPVQIPVAFQILGSPPRPLRFHPGPRSFRALEMMAAPQVLAGVVILPERMPEVARAAMERWLTAAAPASPHWAAATIGVWDSSNPFKGPAKSSWKVKPDESKSPKYKEKLAVALSTSQTVSIVSPEVIRIGHEQGPQAGARLQIPVAGNSTPSHLSFWTAVPTNELRASLESLLDELMGVGVQAFLARWAWIPEFDTVDQYSQTPYEEACGIPLGDAWMQLPWCSRWLRGVGEVTWIGDSLREAAGVSEGKFVATTLEEREAVEQKLQAILPGAQDYGSVNSHTAAG
jgi:hypothetical protein